MKTDLEKITDLIKEKIPFSLIRFGDGEENILNNVPCKRQGFEYDPNTVIDRQFQEELEKSLEFYGGNRYFVGTHNFNLSVQGTIISPAIFINANYPIFLKEVIPLFKNRLIYFVGNTKSNILKLPFKVEKFYAMPNNAWRYEKKLYDLIFKDLNKEKKSIIILVASGPFSNVLIHKLWEKNQKNSYIDIGSILDPFIFGVNTRKYHERIK